MEALEYVKAKNRMTDICHINCKTCPLFSCNNGRHVTCEKLADDFPEDCVRIVEKWAKEHPLKTYAQDFFEKFPNAPRDRKGLPILCKKKIYGGECSSKCTNCWNLKMEET